MTLRECRTTKGFETERSRVDDGGCNVVEPIHPQQVAKGQSSALSKDDYAAHGKAYHIYSIKPKTGKAVHKNTIRKICGAAIVRKFNHEQRHSDIEGYSRVNS